MHLVVNQVVEFQHVHVANSYVAVEFVAGTAIPQSGLPGRVKIGKFQKPLNLGLRSTVEYRRRRRHTVRQVLRKLEDLFITE